DAVVAPRHPEPGAVGGHAAHVGAPADLPRRRDLVGGEVDHGDAAARAVGDVEGTRVAARVEAVCTLPRRDEGPLLHAARVDDRDAVALLVGDVEDAPVG